ncbi:MAG: chloride channel protein [Nevskiaceae bacterium]|nr:MAG: chloride channel protein [Nevskiaceae bacterium]TBR72050.1 MAG: chloride channel protein [Nevskiaceae bacterium]
MKRLPFVEPAVMLATVVQWLVLATATGALVGTATSGFLLALFALAGNSYSLVLWQQMLLLPAAGLANGLLLYYGYRHVGTLKDSEILAVNDQHGHMPLRTALVKPIAGLITLWGGGSAGKEGPCSHIGASVAAALGEALHLNSEIRKRLVACGVSAGFASVFGTPVAGAIYGVEVLAIGRVRHDFLFPGLVAGVTSYQVSLFWGVPYPEYHLSFAGHFTQLLFLKTVLIGILCGVAAWWFVEAIRRVRQAAAWVRRRFNLWQPLVPMLGGFVLAALIAFVPTDYLGLSLPTLHAALDGQPMPYLGAVWKILLVAITLGSGFYGGVVTPQFVIGAVTGSAFAHFFGLGAALGAGVGFCAVVAAASNTPVAAIFMGVELFGGGSTLYVAGASIAAYLIVGHRSVYPEQQLAYTKTSWLSARPDVMVGREKVHLSHGLLRWWHIHFENGRRK